MDCKENLKILIDTILMKDLNLGCLENIKK